MDSGPVLAAQIFSIFAGDTLESLEARVHKTEHELR
ncbi:MAG: hypothetical protein HYR93_06990 [Chloroflexi bacterium]|nr:hypothetical protein [Chloroflexota bacterium]MBI2757594.1 hypothetical protein [Chloroflexota bacterium]